MPRVLRQFRQWDLMRDATYLQLVCRRPPWDLSALGRPQHVHRPRRTVGDATRAGAVLIALMSASAVSSVAAIHLMHGVGIAALDKIWRIAIAAEQRFELFVANPRQHGGTGNLVPVEMQDRKHSAVANRVEKLVGNASSSPAHTSFGFAVANHAGHHEVGVVESGP